MVGWYGVHRINTTVRPNQTRSNPHHQKRKSLLHFHLWVKQLHYDDVIISAIASQITGVSTVCSTVCSSVDQRKHQGPASLGFVTRIHRWPVDSPHKGQQRGKCFHFMTSLWLLTGWMGGRTHSPTVINVASNTPNKEDSELCQSFFFSYVNVRFIIMIFTPDISIYYAIGFRHII